MLHDLQSEPDLRGIRIDKVGIRHLQIPIKVRDRGNLIQETIGTFDASIELADNIKGTHMSRFVEVLHDQKDAYDAEMIGKVMRHLQKKLEARAAFLKLSFPFFSERSAPISKKKSMMKYEVSFFGHLESDHDDHHKVHNEIHKVRDDHEIDDHEIHKVHMEVKVSLKTLCPCSKSISLYGAHSQRGLVKVKLQSSGIWIEDVIEIVEKSGSSPLYSILKRPDEKYVTEQSYENPVFVEDLVRNVVSRLKADDRVEKYRVEAENQESIHNHNAYAIVASTPKMHHSFTID